MHCPSSVTYDIFEPLDLWKLSASASARFHRWHHFKPSRIVGRTMLFGGSGDFPSRRKMSGSLFSATIWTKPFRVIFNCIQTKAREVVSIWTLIAAYKIFCDEEQKEFVVRLTFANLRHRRDKAWRCQIE